MSLQLTTFTFGVQLRGDGTSTQVVVDLTASPVIFSSNVGSGLFTAKNFNVQAAVDVINLTANGSPIGGSISSGKVTLIFSTAPSSGQAVGISGVLVFNGA